MPIGVFNLRALAWTLGVLALSPPACRHGADTREGRSVDPSEVVARVGDAVITASDLRAQINKRASFGRARFNDPANKRRLVDELVQNEVFAAEAARRGYDKDPDVQRAVKQQMISKLVQKDFDSKLSVADVPDADVEKYYNDHLAEFHQREAVGVMAVVVKNKTKADRAYAEARAFPRSLDEQQERFRELVTKYADVPESKSRVGNLLFFYEDSTVVPRPIVDAAFKLKAVGEVAPPLEMDQGWAVILLTQKQPRIDRPLAAVKRQIQQRLFRDLRSKALDAFVEDVRKKSNVTIDDANLSKVVVEAGSGPPPGSNFPGGLEPPISAPPGTPAARPVGMQPGTPP